jgi:hypothetical protein
MSVLRKHDEKIFSNFTEDGLMSATEKGVKRAFCHSRKLVETSRISQSVVNKPDYAGVTPVIILFTSNLGNTSFLARLHKTSGY